MALLYDIALGQVCVCDYFKFHQLYIVSIARVTITQNVHVTLPSSSALSCVIYQPEDFATFFLYIMIGNFVLSLAYYAIMKVGD